METKCDTCGELCTGKTYPVYDENYNKQPGLVMCEKCFAESLGVETHAHEIDSSI